MNFSYYLAQFNEKNLYIFLIRKLCMYKEHAGWPDCWLTLVYLLYVYTLVLHTSYQNVSYYVVVPYRNRTAD